MPLPPWAAAQLFSFHHFLHNRLRIWIHQAAAEGKNLKQKKLYNPDNTVTAINGISGLLMWRHYLIIQSLFSRMREQRPCSSAKCFGGRYKTIKHCWTPSLLAHVDTTKLFSLWMELSSVSFKLLPSTRISMLISLQLLVFSNFTTALLPRICTYMFCLSLIIFNSILSKVTFALVYSQVNNVWNPLKQKQRLQLAFDEVAIFLADDKQRIWEEGFSVQGILRTCTGLLN